MTHASRREENKWSSKLGSNIRITHPRYKLQGGNYGYITVFYTPSPTQASMPALGATAPATEATETAADTAKIASLVEHSAGAFPVLAANFNQNWDAWRST
jgi:hypothetical protein